MEKIPIVPLYFAKERRAVIGARRVDDRGSEEMKLCPGEEQMIKCACARWAAVPCTGAIRSDADTVPKIIEEADRVPPLRA
jgi:sulfate adenylyltransferase subunit 2